MSDSEIFDRKLRRVRRNRAAMMTQSESRIIDLVSADLLDRVQDVPRRFSSALVINAAAPLLHARLSDVCDSVTRADPSDLLAARTDALCFDEDQPTLASHQFDLIISVGLLDTVNDVPGALVLMRRALKPGGLMLCAFGGVGSLSILRDALRHVEPAVQRTHPLIDVRAGGDLLARAGFVRSVADTDSYPINFADAAALLHDLRANAATNILMQRHPMRRAIARTLIAELNKQGPIRETISIVTLTGWAPDSD